jgi:hypothetical protein
MEHRILFPFMTELLLSHIGSMVITPPQVDNGSTKVVNSKTLRIPMDGERVSALPHF